MLHRNARADDHRLGKYNGLGGKIEPDEDVLAGMRREIAEEAGIECTALSLRGTISWPGFGKHGEDWLGFVFVVTRSEEHTSELQSLMRISYAVFCLKKKRNNDAITT